MELLACAVHPCNYPFGMECSACAAERRSDNDTLRQMFKKQDMGKLPISVREQLREEGRREILREVAQMQPIPIYVSPEGTRQEMRVYTCSYCRAESDMAKGYKSAMLKHEPSCLWLRAQQAIKESI